MYRRFAFTLSELLISLSVLGLISAITLPQVFTSVNKVKEKAIFKEAYSLLSTLAMEVSLQETDPSSSHLLEKLRTKVNVNKLCSANVVSEGCWFAGQPADNESTEAGFIMHNGANVYGLHTLGASSGIDAMWIDVNAGSPPNKIGQDILKVNVCYIENQECHDWTAPGYKGTISSGAVTPGGIRAGNLDALSFEYFMN
jgi:prepilin-type N-terminal cleavage/methylation domain-containing protein